MEGGGIKFERVEKERIQHLALIQDSDFILNLKTNRMQLKKNLKAKTIHTSKFH